MFEPDHSDVSAFDDPCQFVSQRLAGEIATKIRESRWFADKDRGTAEFAIHDCGAVDCEGRTLLLVIVEARFSTGPASHYFVPLVTSSERDGMLGDAVGEVFGAWLLRAIAAEDSVELPFGSIAGSRLAALPSSQIHEQGRISRAEQSNSSILFETMIAKVYRRLSPGTNPDVETGEFLADLGAPVAVPRLLGSLSYRSGGEIVTLAMLQEKIDSPEDAWFLLLDALHRDLPLVSTIGLELGALTGALHLAMSSGGTNAAFAPERTSQSVIREWRDGTQQTLNTVRAALSSESIRSDDTVGPLASRFLHGEGQLITLLEGFDTLAGYPLHRVHGDYHLGQVLRDNQGKWWIVDFEGEPRRPIEQRIRKTSPLKDVAGMLRSFAYARATAQSHGWASKDSLAEWEDSTREAFVSSYAATIRAKRDDLIPARDVDLEQAIAAWEIDKALYEVEYELSSRPDWLWVPLASIVDRLNAS